MFKNYLKIVFRNLRREKAYAFINITGLSLGVACFLIICLYLSTELSYDKYNDNHERIFRIAETFDSFASSNVYTGGALGSTLVRDYPEILSSVTFREFSFSRVDAFFQSSENSFFESEILFADNNVFDVFTFDILGGDPATALIDPGSIAISESFAKRYFGDQNPISKVLTEGTIDYTVKLVFSDLPENTHLKYDALLSLSTITPPEGFVLRNNQHYNYILTTEKFTPQNFEDISVDLIERYGDQLDSASTLTLFLEPLAEIYHKSSASQGGRPHGSEFAVYAFSITAVFVLLIASINYVNMATAKSLSRAQEVGVRKVLGATKGQLVRQYLGESLLYISAAFIIGISLTELILSVTPLENLLGYQLSLRTLLDPRFVIGISASLVTIAIASGLYPAFYLANVLPAVALKQIGSRGRQSFKLRQGLILVQFIISISIISSTLLMYAQMNYVFNRSLGFSKEDKIVVPLRGADAIENAVRVAEQLTTEPGIYGASLVDDGSFPGSRAIQSWPIGAVDDSSSGRFNRIYVDENYFELMDIKLLLGRLFDPSIVTDRTEAVIVNETAIRELEWQEPIGKRIWFGGRRGGRQATIIGVVRDMHLNGLQERIIPLAITVNDIDFSDEPALGRSRVNKDLILGINAQSMQESIELVESKWSLIDPIHPFEFRFMDETINGLYFAEERQMQLIGIFSAICVFISCLGLLGLASFSTQRRAKEIGVRKVLGASVGNIVLMLFKSTFYLLLIAAVFASLISFSAVEQWLESFYYRETINPLIFVESTVIALLISFITMASQSYTTAQANPVEALRCE